MRHALHATRTGRFSTEQNQNQKDKEEVKEKEEKGEEAVGEQVADRTKTMIRNKTDGGTGSSMGFAEIDTPPPVGSVDVIANASANTIANAIAIAIDEGYADEDELGPDNQQPAVLRGIEKSLTGFGDFVENLLGVDMPRRQHDPNPFYHDKELDDGNLFEGWEQRSI